MTLQEFVPIFGLLATQLRATDADEMTIRGYFDVLKDAELEFVADAARRLARKVNAEGQSWFPKTGEWLREAVSVEHERLEQQRAYLRSLPAPLCGACSDTGWRRREDDRVEPCACRNVRRLELLGRRPRPMLPPGEAATERPVLRMVEKAAQGHGF